MDLKHDLPDDLPEIDEGTMDDITARIWRNIEIALLSECPEFLRALGWEIKLD